MPGQKSRRYFSLFVLLGASLLLFLAGPLVSRSEGAPFSQGMLKPAFTLAGFVTVTGSALFQFFAIELYDSAAGWRGGEKDAGRKLRFHLAGLASHSYLVGLSFTLLGASLLLVQTNFWIASSITLVALFGLVTVSEIERELWERKDERLHLFTIGRNSGKWREFRLSFVELDPNFYVFAKKPQKDWALNVRRRPQVRIRLRGRTMEAQAHVLDENNDGEEWTTAQRRAREKYGWDVGLPVRITPHALPTGRKEIASMTR
jgi:deazaflavin-dependent oxidoreductase (nitroreductase family)